MANERDVKMGLVQARAAVDPVPTKLVRELRTAVIYLQATLDTIDRAAEVDFYQRQYPGPEVRDVRRKVETSISMLREIIGD